MSFRKIVVAGAGSVGCFIGGHLVAAAKDVTFLGRPRLVEELSEHGLLLTDLTGKNVRVAPRDIAIGTDPAVLALADIVLVTVKSGATREMAALIQRFAAPGTIVISLQNGVDNARILADALPGMRVVAGMVPFNVAAQGGGHFHRGTEGDIVIAEGLPGLAEALSTPDMKIQSHSDMQAIAWGKLLLNLNNALNALAGIPLKDQLQDRRWRLLLATSIAEALAALKAHHIHPARVGVAAPHCLPWVLRLPNFLFVRLVKTLSQIHPLARSSMWDDLENRRVTEVLQLQGAVVALAKAKGLAAPTNARVLQLVQAAEEKNAGSPRLRPEDVAG